MLTSYHKQNRAISGNDTPTDRCHPPKREATIYLDTTALQKTGTPFFPFTFAGEPISSILVDMLITLSVRSKLMTSRIINYLGRNQQLFSLCDIFSSIPNQKDARQSPMATESKSRNDEFNRWNAEHTLDFLYGNSPPSAIGSLAVVLILAYALSSQVAMQTLLPWSVSGIVIGIFRLILWWGYQKRKESHQLKFWLNSYRIMTFASGMLNGLAMWLFFEGIPAEYQLLIFFSIVGLTAAASGTHSVDLVTFQLFMYPSCILSILKLVSYGKPTYSALSLMFVFFVLVMGRVGRQTHKTLKENFKLTYSMHFRATHDNLVGLFNREEFENQFEIHLPLTHHGVAMLFLDLDNFKPLNDTLGHQAGDEALKQVADIMLRSVRQDDIVARLGGDEFVTFLFLDDTKEVEKIAQNIIREVHAITFPDEQAYTGLSASIGIAFSQDNNVSFSHLMRLADTACYRSKEQGKNRVTLSCIESPQTSRFTV